jgi:DNA-binding response OmpR family regulator
MKETILVVEDDPLVWSLLERVLTRSLGYRVLLATDGATGLELALAKQPHAMLLDLGLPGLPGLELMRELQNRRQTIPTIVVTAEGHTEQILQAFRLGAKDFLQKPVEIDVLRAALENALTEARLRRERDRLTKALTAVNIRQNQQLENWAALNYMVKALVSTLEEAEVLRRVVAAVNQLLDVEAGSLLLLDPETQMLSFAVTLRGEEMQISEIKLKVGQGIAGWVAQTGEVLLIPDVTQDPRFYAEVDQLTGFRSKAILCVPLKLQGRILGVLEVINKRNGTNAPSFTKADQETLTTLASWIAVAVENARLNSELQDAAAVRTLRQMVVTLAHHINNQLMTISLELESIEQQSMPPEARAAAAMRVARVGVKEIQGIVRALGGLNETRGIPYIGSEEMLDIGKLVGT